MIYQSMSGDAGEGTGTLSASNSSLSIDSNSSYYKTAPFFFITNTNAVINLENSELDFGSGILLSAKGTINSGNTAKSVSLTLDSSSKMVLTGDTYVSEFSDEDANYSNIDFNGYKLYVNGNAIN